MDVCLGSCVDKLLIERVGRRVKELADISTICILLCGMQVNLVLALDNRHSKSCPPLKKGQKQQNEAMSKNAPILFNR
jgi:hypothetical protein